MFVHKKNPHSVLSLLFLIFIVFSCSSPKILEMTTPPPSVQYFIGPEDILAIAVWKEPDLSGTVPVRPDGKISLPLVNDVQAAGLTPLQLKDLLTKELSKYVEDPTVSVSVTSVNSFKIFVIGNVISPGTVQVQREVSIVQAISLAGGFNEWAKKSKIKIFRKDGDVEKTININYKKIVQGKEPNIPIYPGDTIIIP
jgi:polysaccharide export outer membrane protein